LHDCLGCFVSKTLLLLLLLPLPLLRLRQDHDSSATAALACDTGSGVISGACHVCCVSMVFVTAGGLVAEAWNQVCVMSQKLPY
jgi:hypothetical protein